LPKLSSEEYEALKESIHKNGLYAPIIVNQDKIVLDGHHRLRACYELGIVPRFEINRQFEGDELSEREYVIEVNLRRRHLNEFQRGLIGFQLLEIERLKAKERMRMGGGSVHMNLPEKEKGQARDFVAKKVNLSSTTFQRILTIIPKISETDKSRLETGELTISQAYKKIIQQERRQAFYGSAKGEIPEHVQLIHSNFEACEDQFAEKIDAIITDPPYGAEYMDIWEKLGKFAQTVLKPNGLLIFYSGDNLLPEKLWIVNKFLKYFWMEIKIMEDTGSLYYVGDNKIYHRFKPTFIFYKDTLLLPETFAGHSDVYESHKRPEKAVHEWEQEVEYSIYLINKYLLKSTLVCDPMCGSGSTVEACIRTGHPVIGVDKDIESIKISEARCKKVQAEMEVKQHV
jgi:16S rRNA G966 N2-methylase RsmD